MPPQLFTLQGVILGCIQKFPDWVETK